MVSLNSSSNPYTLYQGLYQGKWALIHKVGKPRSSTRTHTHTHTHTHTSYPPLSLLFSVVSVSIVVSPACGTHLREVAAAPWHRSAAEIRPSPPPEKQTKAERSREKQREAGKMNTFTYRVIQQDGGGVIGSHHEINEACTPACKPARKSAFKRCIHNCTYMAYLIRTSAIPHTKTSDRHRSLFSKRDSMKGCPM